MACGDIRGGTLAATLRSIHIENFRSIRSLDADLSRLTVFTGRNDSGKSNILRALNLFFNEQTNPDTEFDFEDDYNFFAPIRARRAREVVVRLEINLPESYHRTNGQFVVWTKRWREDGLVDDEYRGVRLSRNRRGQEVKTYVDVPEKSNVHALLRKIDFEYVPAVKDNEYFDTLRGRIYGIIAEVAARTFHASSTEFELSIGRHLGDLTTSISQSLGFETRLALPRDLSHIFERLDFQSGDRSVSLNNRGDGIKARHIPLILKFMAERKAQLQRRGGQPVSSIWAYEEPENNLEIASAVQLADELLALTTAGTAQILLTTHSPAFYDLGQRVEDVQLNFVARQSDDEGTALKDDVTGIDESLGTLAMLAPRISELIAEVRQQENAKADAARLAEINCPRLFVEGESDRIVLQKALELFFPAVADQLRIETKAIGAGHTYVIDMLLGWRSQHKHHPERPKAVGIVDGDARSECTAFNAQPDNVRSAKCFVYPQAHAVRAAKAAHFKIHETLETLYPYEVWVDAQARDRLKPRDLAKTYPTQLIERILIGDAEPGEGLEEAWSIYVTHDFDPDHKTNAARNLIQRDDETLRDTLAPFEPLLRKALAFLSLVEPI